MRKLLNRQRQARPALKGDNALIVVVTTQDRPLIHSLIQITRLGILEGGFAASVLIEFMSLIHLCMTLIDASHRTVCLPLRLLCHPPRLQESGA